MSKETYKQAIMTKQGRKALKGDTIGYTDDEVREKGRSRVVRRAAAATLLSTVALGASVYGVVKNDQVSANQVKADKAEAGKIFANPGPGLNVRGGAPVASASEATTAPAAAPTEGAWTPTPGSESQSAPAPTSPAPESYNGQNPDMGGVSAEPAGSETGGVAAK